MCLITYEAHIHRVVSNGFLEPVHLISKPYDSEIKFINFCFLSIVQRLMVKTAKSQTSPGPRSLSLSCLILSADIVLYVVISPDLCFQILRSFGPSLELNGINFHATVIRRYPNRIFGEILNRIIMLTCPDGFQSVLESLLQNLVYTKYILSNIFFLLCYFFKLLFTG